MGESLENSPASLDQVRSFWDAHPCGSAFIDEPFGTPAFFAAHRAYRYRHEWHLDELVPFDQYRGKRVLEIGCGVGADGARFAAAGALYTGIDLTPAAVEATRMRFQVEGLEGQFLVQNAENLRDLPADHYDLVYSQGVLHHTPRTAAALAQACRVLKPGGDLVLMLYHRRSFNYYVRILTWMRLQLLGYLAVRPFLPAGKRPDRLEAHRRNMAAVGARYLSARTFAHHCADGPDCPLAFSFTRSEVTAMLEPQFTDIRHVVAHLPIHRSFPGFPKGWERRLARVMGWYLFTYARKPAKEA